MALILNIETATEICSVSIGQDGVAIDTIEEKKAYSHASMLTPLIQELLKRNRISMQALDAVAVSAGPGSYTGLRIGSAAAKGLCYALEIPLIRVSTLEALAAGIREEAGDPEALYCPVIDARRDEVYTAIYDFELNQLMPDCPLKLDATSYSAFLGKQDVHFGGNASEKLKSSLFHSGANILDEVKCSASHMVRISDRAANVKKFENLIYFEPSYLKDFRGKLKKVEKK